MMILLAALAIQQPPSMDEALRPPVDSALECSVLPENLDGPINFEFVEADSRRRRVMTMSYMTFDSTFLPTAAEIIDQFFPGRVMVMIHARFSQPYQGVQTHVVATDSAKTLRDLERNRRPLTPAELERLREFARRLWARRCKP